MTNPPTDKADVSGDGSVPGLGGDGSELGASVPKLETGIAGFDQITMGGLPRGRATVVAGQAGSAKTVFAGQFLGEGVRRGQPGVFVSLEEPVGDLRDNLETLGHHIGEWEAAADWRFVDASPLVRLNAGEPGLEPYRLETLMAQIGHAVDATGAQRLVLDSVNAMVSLQPDMAVSRQLLSELINAMRAMGLSIMLTVEASDDPRSIGSFGIEEFVADNVVILKNVQEGRVRRRTIEVLKMRGAMHHKGEASFTVLPGRGVVVLPTTRRPRETPSGVTRVTSGNESLDDMLHGGVPSTSVTVVAGATGTGKSLLATEFLAGAAEAGERALLISYDESHGQVLRNAAGWGRDFAGLEQRGLLRISTSYPDAASLDDHFVEMQDLVRRFRPVRVAVDSVSGLERLGTDESFREFTTRLFAFLNGERIATLLTVVSAGVPVPESAAEAHIDALADVIVLLRRVEADSVMRRAILVLKLRGDAHEEQIRSFSINDRGLQIGEPLSGVTGVFSAR